MINNQMKNKENKPYTQNSGKPNEVGGIYFSSNIKIYDPNSNEVLVQKRGDN
jgi:hypothetical protein